MIGRGDELLLARRAPAARERPARPPASISSGSSRAPISRRETEPVETAGREHDRVQPALAQLAQRVSTFPRSGSSERRLSASSCARRRAEAVPIRMTGPKLAAPNSASRGSSRSGYRRRPGRPCRSRSCPSPSARRRRCAPRARLLELLDEDAARADLAERAPAIAVAGRRDRDERDLDAGARAAARQPARPA